MIHLSDLSVLKDVRNMKTRIFVSICAKLPYKREISTIHVGFFYFCQSRMEKTMISNRVNENYELLVLFW